MNSDDTFNGEAAAASLAWIRSLPQPRDVPTGLIELVHRIPQDVEYISEDVYSHYMCDGMLLCYVLACLDPAMSAKLEAMRMFRGCNLNYVNNVLERKRIGLFLTYAKTIGVDSKDLFAVDDLNKSFDLGKVIYCLDRVRSLCNSKAGDPNGYWDSDKTGDGQK